jgi:glycosyltransferase involved in cell wall biosynthesis
VAEGLSGDRDCAITFTRAACGFPCDRKTIKREFHSQFWGIMRPVKGQEGSRADVEQQREMTSLAAKLPSIQKGSGLHVLTLTPFYPNDRDATNGCFISEPLDWLARTGVRNTVYAVQPFYRTRRGANDATAKAHWFRYISLPGGFGLPIAGVFLFAQIIGRVRELHRSQRIDLIHAHAPLPCGHAAMLLSAELKIPYVVSVHGLDAFSTEQVGGRAGEWCRRISQRVYRSSRRGICISERVREQVLEGTGQNCRTSVVYNGVNPEIFSPGSEPLSGGPVILSVGNLIPIKGHEVLVRAVAALTAEFPELTLDIIGRGPEQSRLQNLAQQLGIGDSVRFLGLQSRHHVAAAMRRCTVFVLPSRYEGLGCVYLEAMSTAKPVIGCRGQGIAEIIRHGWNGFLVGPDNERELILTIAMLLRDKSARHNIGIAARDTILERFTLASQTEGLARIYWESVE